MRECLGGYEVIERDFIFSVTLHSGIRVVSNYAVLDQDPSLVRWKALLRLC